MIIAEVKLVFGGLLALLEGDDCRWQSVIDDRIEDETAVTAGD